MHIIIHTAVSILLIDLVRSLHVVRNEGKDEEANNKNHRSMRKVLEHLADSKSYLTNVRRDGIDPVKLAKAKSVFEVLSRSLSQGQFKNILRALSPSTTLPPKGNVEFEDLIEKELEDTEVKHNSMLMEKAYVEKKGPNDFLVLHPGIQDPFVTVIPNDIRYNIEKKCANWMDDCTVQGIRQRLLQKVRSPYKKK